jgi:hypothetical protein
MVLLARLGIRAMAAAPKITKGTAAHRRDVNDACESQIRHHRRQTDASRSWCSMLPERKATKLWSPRSNRNFPGSMKLELFRILIFRGTMA